MGLLVASSVEEALALGLAIPATNEGTGDAAPDAGEKLTVYDLHCDTLDRLCLSGDPTVPGGFFEKDAGVPRERMSRLDDNDGQISLAHMMGFNWCQCFAVFVPDELSGDEAWSLYARVRDFWRGELERLEGDICQVNGPDGAAAAFAAGKSAGMLTVEGLSVLMDDGTAGARLDRMAEDGVVMATLTWNGPNALGSGNRTSDGLTTFGRAVVTQLERRGIVVDASHLNDQGFKDLLDIAQRPFACSHSNARAVCDHPRNLQDWQLREIAQRGGIVGLNYFNDFLRDDGMPATQDDLLRHVDHILEIAGEGVLALGSDYDGSDVPDWLAPCSAVGQLHGLLASEFGQQAAERIFHGNAERFFAERSRA